MHLLPCPNCQQFVRVSPSQAGDNIRCNGCDTNIDIPKLGELRQLPVAEQDDKADGDISKRNENSTGRRITSSILGCIAILMLITAAYCGFRWASVKPGSSTEKHIEVFAEELPNLEAALLVRHFESMEKGSLDLPMMYNYKVDELQKTREGNKAMISGAICLITGVLSIVIASTGRTSDN